MKKYNQYIIGVHYTMTLIVAISIILLCSRIFDIADPTWALISGVICTEIDLTLTKNIVMKRTVFTVLGVIFGLIMLLVLGSHVSTLLIGIAAVTLICHCIPSLTNNWKFITATAMVILVVAIQQHSIELAEITAFKRATEVAFGSIIAGIVSILSCFCVKRIKK